MPDTTPLVGLMDTVPDAPLNQVPPAGAEDRVPLPPRQSVSEPEIEDGAAFTVTVLVEEQPPAVV